jgi:hypothetical protein
MFYILIIDLIVTARTTQMKKVHAQLDRGIISLFEIVHDVFESHRQAANAISDLESLMESKFNANNSISMARVSMVQIAKQILKAGIRIVPKELRH